MEALTGLAALALVPSVRALHDFVPLAGSNTCLSFKAGQVIRTLNRDSSGWWDGEVDGKRGWFPSNYVEEIPTEGGRRAAQTARAGSPGAVQASAPSLNKASPRRSTSPTALVALDSPPAGVLETMQQALALLQAAAIAGRASHFQPSTACVISSVRSVLSCTDCLTRDSRVLRRHPALAVERKHILASLAALVNEARLASDPGVSADDTLHDPHAMLSMAGSVQDNVTRFLELAAKVGVKLSMQQESTSRSSTPRTSPSAQTSVPAARRPELREAKSVGDFRTRRPSLVVAPPLLRTVSSGPMSAPLPSSPSVLRPSAVQHNHVIRSSDELSNILSVVHDNLLSTIAAFIGHAHAHTRSAHPSSYAHLIDRTRDTIEKVREVLIVVEAVLHHPVLMRTHRHGLEVLATCREALFIATTSLVTAARIVTSAPLLDTAQAEEAERYSLLQSATAVLRSGRDCVSAITACIAEPTDGDVFELVLPELDPDQEGTKGTTSARDCLEHQSMSNSGTRRAHTLSMLGRKATSLSCLRDKYQPVNEVLSVQEEPEEDEECLSESPESTSGLPSLETRFGEDDPFSPEQYGGWNARGANNMVNAEAAPPAPRSDSTLTSARSRRGLSSSSAGAEGSPVTASAEMTREESSRTSGSPTSSRAGVSPPSTTDTSPRSSHEAPRTLLPGDGAIRQSPAPIDTTRSDAPHRLVSVRLSTPLPEAPLSPASPTPAPAMAYRDGSAWFLQRDYEAREISFNGDGHVTGGTLRCLLERMTLHDTTIDLTFSNTFFLTFRMFTNPSELAESLYRRFDVVPPSLQVEELKIWTARKATPIRLRVYNFFKIWLENFWQQDTDGVIVESLLAFCRDRLMDMMASAAHRLIGMIHKRASASPPELSRSRRGTLTVHDRTWPETASGGTGAPSYPAPLAMVTKNVLVAFRAAPTSGTSVILDIDPLELARQLTIMESRLFCAIAPEELLSIDFSKKVSVATNIRAMSTLSTKLTGWVAETVLNERDTRKRTSLVKYFIKLCERCLSLNNYNTLMAVLCALTSSTISRLRKTWDGLSSKYTLSLEVLRKATEHSRNYAEYRGRIRNALPPTLPFLGLFLTDITFCYEGNSAQRQSPLDSTLGLINFDRYQKMSKLIGEMQRFQVPYDFGEVPELQEFLKRMLNGLSEGGDVSALYRQSLVLEPRRPSDASAFSKPLQEFARLR